jgi:hypothetical protein
MVTAFDPEFPTAGMSDDVCWELRNYNYELRGITNYWGMILLRDYGDGVDGARTGIFVP